MNESPSFGIWLRQRRRSANLTQAQLARRAGCAEDTLQKIESGALRPSKQLAARIASVLGASADELDTLVARARDAGSAPAAQPAPAPARPANLPAQLTELIGRGQDIAQVRALLQRAHLRLVTLTGPGGTGKTRVAIESARQLQPAFRDGVSFIDLSTISDAALVLTTIAHHFGVFERAEQRLDADLANALREQALLLVIDNFEQVIAAAPALAQLLASCPQLKALVTSRIPLGIAGEHEQPIPPLGLPMRAQALPLERLRQFEAVRLFAERANAVNQQFTITASNAPAIAELCHRLDGLPLAIELVAAWSRLFEPTVLLERLDQLLSRTVGERGRPARQQTVWSAIDWSYGLLGPAEQALFRQIGAFAGGGTLSAIEAVASGSAGDIVDGVLSLLNHSLLRRIGWSPDDAETNPRVGMLETIREYAAAQLRASPDAAAVRQRHARYFTSLAESIQAQLVGPQQAGLLRQLEDDYDNMRAALDWSLHGGDIALGLRLANGLAEFWELRGYVSEGVRWLSALLAAETAPSQIRLNALHAAIVLAVNQVNVEQADALAGEYAATAQALGHPLQIAQAIAERAQVAKLRTDFDQAVSLFEQALVRFREQGAKGQVAAMQLNLGLVIGRDQGDPARAAPHLAESQRLYEELQYPKGMLFVLMAQAAMFIQQQDSAGALTTAKRALQLSWSSEFLGQAGICLFILAAPTVMQQRPARAVFFLSAADALFTQQHITLDPPERAGYEYWLGVARAALDADAFAAAWEQGQALPPEQIVAEALA